MTQPLLRIDNLSIAFSKQDETRTVVSDLTLQIQRGETLATVDPASQQRELEGLLRELAQRNEADPNFWDSASLADLQLVRLLAQPTAPPRKRGDTSLPPALAVLATYRNAIARGASPREVSSVAEHIAFLIALWSPDDKPKQRILQQIQENLS